MHTSKIKTALTYLTKKEVLKTELKKIGIPVTGNYVKRSYIIKALTSDTETVSEQITIDYNDKEYLVNIEVTLVTDPNYGADADNRRGVPMTYVEGIEVEDIVALDDNGKETDEEINDKDRKEIEKLTYNEVKNIRWDDFRMSATLNL